MIKLAKTNILVGYSKEKIQDFGSRICGGRNKVLKSTGIGYDYEVGENPIDVCWTCKEDPYIIYTFSFLILNDFLTKTLKGELSPGEVKIFLVEDEKMPKEFIINESGELTGEHPWPSDFKEKVLAYMKTERKEYNGLKLNDYKF